MMSSEMCNCVMFFFFQAEDGIRDDLVTGVQTCALPICSTASSASTWGPSPTAATPTRSTLLWRGGARRPSPAGIGRRCGTWGAFAPAAGGAGGVLAPRGGGPPRAGSIHSPAHGGGGGGPPAAILERLRAVAASRGGLWRRRR